MLEFPDKLCNVYRLLLIVNPMALALSMSFPNSNAVIASLLNKHGFCSNFIRINMSIYLLMLK